MKQNKIPRNEYIIKPKGKTNPYKDDVVYSNLGQWKYPGQVTKIPSNQITMQGVNYPVQGIDDTGYSQMMYPGMDYTFPGEYVTEYPMQFPFGGIHTKTDTHMATGGWLDSYEPGGEKPWGDMTAKERAAYLDAKESNAKAETASRKQATKEHYQDYVKDSMKKTLEHPMFNTAQYFTPEGMAIGAIKGLANVGPDVAKGDYSAAAFDALTALPAVAPAVKNAYRINPWAEKLNNPKSSYRVAGLDAGEDFKKTGALRSQLPDIPEGASLKMRAMYRPTSFPSFQKGYADLDYLPDKGGVIFKTDLPTFKRGQLNPVTGFPIKGRHYAHRVIDPKTGATVTNIPGADVKMYSSEPHWLKGYQEIPVELPGSPNGFSVDNVGKGIKQSSNKIDQSIIDKYTQREIDWLNSDEYIRRNIKATGKSKEAVIKERNKIFDQIDKTTLNVLDDKADMAAGVYSQNKKNPVINLFNTGNEEQLLNVADHEIKHAASQQAIRSHDGLIDLVTNPYKKYPTVNVKKWYDNFIPGETTSKWASNAPEQQVVSKRIMDLVEKTQGVKRGTQLTDDNIKGVTDLLNKEIKNGNPQNSDIVAMLSSFKSKFGKNYYPIVKDMVNKAYIAPVAIGAAALQQEKFGGWLDEFAPGGEKIKISDKRKIRQTTGKAINPNKDLKTGSYDKAVIDSLAENATRRGVNPYQAIAMSLIESKLGKVDSNVGHVSNFKDSVSPYKQMMDEVLKSQSVAKRLNKTDPAAIIQAYNGYGKLFPSTEKGYHGFEASSFYGVPVDKKGLNMKENPLYGKEVLDIQKNIIEKDPNIKNIVTSYQYPRIKGYAKDWNDFLPHVEVAPKELTEEDLNKENMKALLNSTGQLKKGGQKGLKSYTSKNIQSSVNDIMLRNETLFGPAGKKRYKANVKYKDGGNWLDNMY